MRSILLCAICLAGVVSQTLASDSGSSSVVWSNAVEAVQAGKYAEAIPLLVTVERAKREAGETQTIEYAAILSYLGAALVRGGQAEEGREVIRRWVSCCETQAGPCAEIALEARRVGAEIFVESFDFVGAAKLLDPAKKCFLDKPPLGPTQGLLVVNIALLECLLGSPSSARHYMHLGVKALEDSWGRDDERLKPLREQLADMDRGQTNQSTRAEAEQGQPSNVAGRVRSLDVTNRPPAKGGGR